MNSRYKKILSLLMAFALILQFSVTLTAFAEDTNEGSDAALAVEETSKDEKEEQAKSNEEKKDTASEESTAEEAENKSEGEEASESEKSDQADDEDQSEEPGDTDTQDASAANATVSDNALAAANDDDETITITVHPSSREGIDFAETVVIKAKKGSTYNDIKDQIPAMNNIPGYKTYAAWQMKKPLSEATSESDALDSRFTGNEVLTENTDVYYPLSKMFN